MSAMEAASGSPGGTRSSGLPERHWLSLLAILVAVGCLVPPVTVFAGRYVFVESIQFSLLAMVVPALAVLGAPWRLLGLSRPAATGPPDGATRRAGPADRLALARSRHPSFVRSAAFLAVFAGVAGFWRLPAVVDGLARDQALALLEMASLLLAGTGLWLELAVSPPLRPRRRGPQRAVIAALAMWFIWIVAYILGFAGHPVFAAYADQAGAPLGGVADQELATAVMWLVAALCFVPVVFAAALGWLRDSEHPDADAEFRRVADEGSLPPVRGWGHPRRRKASSA